MEGMILRKIKIGGLIYKIMADVKKKKAERKAERPKERLKG